MTCYDSITNCARRHFPMLARIVLALIYIWFGLLKAFNVSPAETVVQELFERTIDFMPFVTFYTLFACFEIIIGILFLIPRWTRLAVTLFVLHMIATTMPLVALPTMSWSGWFVPTLTGQYIIKNLALIACVFGIMAASPKKA